MKVITEMEWRDLFSRYVRERMDILYINQKELVDKIGVTPATISCYLKGSRTPKVDVIIKISRVLECSMDYLIDFGFVKLDDCVYSAREED